MGGVNIELANGQLGATLQTNDGICGMVLNGTPDGDYVLGTPILVTSLVDAESQGITEDTNPFAHRQISGFYDKAGDGAQLYLLLVVSTLTVNKLGQLTEPQGAKKLLDYAQGAIKVLGIMADDDAFVDGDGVVTVTNGLNGNVYTAATNLQATLESYATAQMPMRSIIGASSYSGTPAALTDITTNTDNRVGILVGDTQAGNAAALGLLLGTMAALPVQRKISRVANGALPNTAAFLASAAIETKPGDAAVIAGKGFITWQKFPNRSGYYWSDDPTASPTTDDYHFAARGRVIDKAQRIAYDTFLNSVADEIPTDQGTGNIDAGYALALQQKIVTALTNAMVAKGEATGAACKIPLNQQPLATSELEVNVGVTPYGYADQINVKLGFQK
jgi:hypothetical protein